MFHFESRVIKLTSLRLNSKIRTHFFKLTTIILNTKTQIWIYSIINFEELP